MDKIKSITEAFSMQPNTWSVFEGSSFRTDIKPSDIAEIKLERTGPDEFYDYLYRAYNSNGKKLFEWQPKAVNVAYFID